jgi:hypothetical protein
MAITPRMVVDPPEPRGLRYGLFVATNGPNDLLPHGAAGGVTYDPVSCGQAHYYDTACGGGGGEKTFDANDALINANPFTVYASLQCGSAGTTPAALETKVLRRLSNGEQTIVEYGMGLVLAAGATPLAPADATMTGIVSDLEQWLYGIGGANYGNVGYLHAAPRMAAYAAEETLVVRDGPLLKTPLGTIWSFGGGYPDNGTIYISGQVTVWRTPGIFVTPPDQVLNLTTNQYHMLAEREYAVAYDCVAASAVFDWMPIS